MAKSAELFAQANTFIPGGVNSPVRAFKSVGGAPFFTERAQGATLTTVDGQQLIDFVGSWGPAINGHAHPYISEKIQEALAKGTGFGTPNPYEVLLAEKIVQHVPSIEKVRMVNSGTEATMSAIRLARGFTGRNKILKFTGCYHGHVDSLLVKAGSGALTFGSPDSAGVPASYAADTLLVDFNDIQGVQAAFQQYSQDIAAVILEPYAANCSLILPQPGFLKKLRTLCSDHGTLLIFDEVMTGFRQGLSGVQGLTGITPDLTTLAKIIGGGLPVGAFGGRADVMEHLSPSGAVYQAGTMSGNPLAMAAGLAAIELLERQNPYAQLDQKAAKLTAHLSQAASEVGIPLSIPQAGSMFALCFSTEPVTNYASALKMQTAQFNKLFHYALERGVFLPPSAFETCFIGTAHSEEILDQAAEILASGIRALAQ